MRAATADLLDALRSTPWDATAWAWWRDEHVVGAIGRHQVQEAAVHRWDAQSAVGTPEPLPMAIADDGVDEFLWIARQLREPAPIAFRLTDSGHTFAASSEPVAATVTATASDVVLLLHGRIAHRPLCASTVIGPWSMPSSSRSSDSSAQRARGLATRSRRLRVR